MAKKGPIKIDIRGLQAKFDAKWVKEAGLPEKDLFSKTVSDFNKLMSQSLSEEEKLKKGQSLYFNLRKDGKLEHFPTEFRNDLAICFDDRRAQGPQEDDQMSSSQRPDRGHDDNQSLDAGQACQQSTHSPSQSRKQGPQSGLQENQDGPKLPEHVKQLEQDLNDERKKTKDQEHLLQDRLIQIKEKEGELNRLEKEAEHFAKSLEEEKKKYSNASKDAMFRQEQIGKMEMQLNEYSSREFQFKQQIMTWEHANKEWEKERRHAEKSMHRERETMKDEMVNVHRKHDEQMKKLVEERDDLRDRFSKLAGARLQDQNSDIADLSDPNRAMKLSERFGQIYDDEWTNAFELLAGKKINMPPKDAIALLLRILQDCLAFCNGLMESQMDSLKNVILHPPQDMSKYAADPRTNIAGLKAPRIGSKDELALRVLRRQVCVDNLVVEEIKNVFLLETICWGKEKKDYNKKLLEACSPYLQKCAELCWLMVLHDPPLYMKMDSKHGEKFDSNIFTVYSTSGDKLDYIVWPPLYNGRDGGLLSKGSAEPLRTIGRKK